jgi:hypothetical protein
MAFEFRDLTDPEVKTLADVGQKIAALGVEKAKIQTERATAEIGWNKRSSAIDAEIHILSDSIAYLRTPTEK